MIDATKRADTRPKTGKTLTKAAKGSKARPRGPRNLARRYRPRALADIVGQPLVVEVLEGFAADPYPAAFLFEGDTGTGKSSAALALAAALGCDMDQEPPEFGGLHVLASGEQTADAVRELVDRMHRVPFSGSGWKVVILNECDRITKQAETVWLDRLEDLPPRTVVVLTTNYPEKLAPRFRDRCMRLEFESHASRLQMDAYSLLADIWRREIAETEPDMQAIARAVDAAVEDGRLSFRRAVQRLEAEMMKVRKAMNQA